MQFRPWTHIRLTPLITLNNISIVSFNPSRKRRQEAALPSPLVSKWRVSCVFLFVLDFRDVGGSVAPGKGGRVRDMAGAWQGRGRGVAGMWQGRKSLRKDQTLPTRLHFKHWPWVGLAKTLLSVFWGVKESGSNWLMFFDSTKRENHSWRACVEDIVKTFGSEWALGILERNCETFL